MSIPKKYYRFNWKGLTVKLVQLPNVILLRENLEHNAHCESQFSTYFLLGSISDGDKAND